MSRKRPYKSRQERISQISQVILEGAKFVEEVALSLGVSKSLVKYYMHEQGLRFTKTRGQSLQKIRISIENGAGSLLDKESCNKANEIFWSLRKKGIGSGKFDCMIAGIFLVKGVNKIITRNVKHFENIAEIDIVKY